MIYTPKVFGTCNGAKRAVDLAYSLAKEEEKVVIFKDILHNSRVIDDLKKLGIECISNLDDISSETSVIIRAHGEGKEVYDYFASKGIKVYDATCPNVIKIHDIIKDRYEKGFSIVIIGKKNHPEVVGSNGWCDNKALIIENLEDISNIKNLSGKVLIICQTTISTEMYDLLSKEIISRFNCDFEFINTVCMAQKAIQNSSIELAKKMDYVFVVGGEKSSNTRELYNMCSKYCKSYMFSNLSDFFAFLKNETNLNENSKICITGGASTPIYQIEEYKSLLEFYFYYKSKLSLFDKIVPEINSSFLDEKENANVYDAILKFISLNSGGKYVRALLINLGYEIFGKKKDYSMMLSLAYEVFQTSILIHDDVIDNANTRRGKKTIPVLYCDDFETFDKKKDDFEQIKKSTADSLAICLGDLGYYFANKMILNNYSKDKNLISVLNYYNDIVTNTIKGEIIDVILPFKEQFFNSSICLDDVLKISELKTSWYTVVGPFCLGMTLAGASVDDVKKFENILMPLGIAFQIKDDLLGIYSDNLIVGKDSSDISEFKQTLLYYYAINQKSYRNELLKYYGKKDLTKEDIEVVRTIFEQSGAKSYAIDMMNNLFNKAREDILSLDINDKFKKILLGFVLYLELRNK